MARVERSMDLQGNDFSLFETAILLEGRVQDRTAALERALRDLQQTNQALEEAKLAADEANLSKTRFLAAASHDVLQPLNAARLFLSALGETEQTPSNQKLIENIDQAFEAVERLLSALLDISKLDAGVLRPEITEVGLGDLLRSLATEFRPIAEDRGLSLRYVPVRCTVRTDPQLLARVIRNFMSNAVRYTKRGGLLLGCRRVGEAVRIEVCDTGSGMPADKLDEIFEEFRRLVGASDDYERGFGLGLAIVKRIAKMLDHDLLVRSELDRGSSFAITVPVASWTSQTARTMADANRFTLGDLEHATVFVIENEPAILEAMQILLEGWGCRVICAPSQRDAQMKLGLDGLVPDIIIADYHLDQGANGVDAIVEMRMRYLETIPGVIVTADRSKETRKRAADSGLSLLNKPVRPGRLRSLLTHLLATSEITEAEPGG